MATAVSNVSRRNSLSQILADIVKFAVGSAIDGSLKIIPGRYLFLFRFNPILLSITFLNQSFCLSIQKEIAHIRFLFYFFFPNFYFILF